MAGVKNIFTWDDKATQAMLGRVARRMTDLAPVMKAFGEHMLAVTQRRFTGEHDPDGAPWKPLAPATLKYKKGNKILTGRGMRAGLRGTIAYQAGVRQVKIGTNKIYGAIHQLGGQAGRGRKVTIPARPYLGINDDDRREFVLICHDYLGGGA